MRITIVVMSLLCCIILVISACDTTDVTEVRTIPDSGDKLPPISMRQDIGVDDGCNVAAWELAATLHGSSDSFRVVVTNTETGSTVAPDSPYSDPYEFTDESDVHSDCDWIADSSGGKTGSNVHTLAPNTLYQIEFIDLVGSSDRTFLYMDCPSGGTADRTCTQGEPAVNLHDVYFAYSGDWYVRPAQLTGEDGLGSSPTYGSWEGIDDYVSSGWILNEVLPDVCEELPEPCATSEETVSYFLQDGNPDEMTFYWPRYDGDLLITWPPDCAHDCMFVETVDTPEEYCTSERGADDWADFSDDVDDQLENKVRAFYDLSAGWESGSGTYSGMYLTSVTCTY